MLNFEKGLSLRDLVMTAIINNLSLIKIVESEISEVTWISLGSPPNFGPPLAARLTDRSLMNRN